MSEQRLARRRDCLNYNKRSGVLAEAVAQLRSKRHRFRNSIGRLRCGGRWRRSQRNSTMVEREQNNIRVNSINH